MRSPTIAGVEKPAPMSLICQTTLGPSLGHSLRRPFSEEMPSRLGPRHWGQSVARVGAGMSSKTQAEALNELNRLNGLNRVSLTLVGFIGRGGGVAGFGWTRFDQA